MFLSIKHLLATGLIGLSAFTSAQAASLQLAAPTTVNVGQTFSITVAIDQPFDGIFAGDELLAFGFDLFFDSTQLKLLGASVAPGWDDDSASLPDVDVAGSAFPGITDAGQATLQLATVSFQLLTAGSTSVRIGTDVDTNWSHGLIYFNNAPLALNGTVAITSAVPEPDSVALLLAGLGLAGVAARRRMAA